MKAKQITRCKMKSMVYHVEYTYTKCHEAENQSETNRNPSRTRLADRYPEWFSIRGVLPVPAFAAVLNGKVAVTQENKYGFYTYRWRKRLWYWRSWYDMSRILLSCHGRRIWRSITGLSERENLVVVINGVASIKPERVRDILTGPLLLKLGLLIMFLYPDSYHS